MRKKGGGNQREGTIKGKKCTTEVLWKRLSSYIDSP